MAKKSKKKKKPKKKCCRSKPRCKRCPVRMAAEARQRQRRRDLAQLVDEVLRGSPRPLPDAVTEALAELALAASAPRPRVHQR